MCPVVKVQVCISVIEHVTRIIKTSTFVYHMIKHRLPSNSLLHICCDVGLRTGVTEMKVKFDLHVHITGPHGVISTAYVSSGCTPNSVTLVLLTVIGDWSELTL